MPLRFSFRNAFSRASRVRMSRNERRTLERNSSVTITISGSTENVTREQLGVEPAHRDHDADQREQVAEQRAHAGGEQLVEHVDVVRHARHQAADRVAVEVRDRQALQMCGTARCRRSQHHALADALHDLVLQIAEPEADREQRQVDHRDAIEEAQVVVADAVVDRLLGEPRAGQRDQRVDRSRPRPRSPPRAAIGAQVRQQPAHQPVVVGASAGFVFVVAHDASSSSSSCCARHSVGVVPAAARAARRGVPRSTIAPSLEHEDQVGIAHRAHAVRDDQRGAPPHLALEPGEDRAPRCACRRSRGSRRAAGPARRAARARAIATRCFCPPESVMPRSPTRVS